MNQTSSKKRQQPKSIGPYVLGKELGVGQTGKVRKGMDLNNGKTVAVKIINKKKFDDSVLSKIEREITIMKLIDHPNIIGLYDVYETDDKLYLIIEYVSGGELFDHLSKHKRLEENEGRRIFKQIISALDFCHNHLICHRDLKPENLLLDDQENIKIADFGMASLQVDGAMLETSCGSPHYACPEVINGEKYDGRKADVWSCGVILYALLVGSLPFDHDKIMYLLQRIRSGDFFMPNELSPDCQNLLRNMIQVNPEKRITIDKINTHPWVLADSVKYSSDSNMKTENIIEVVSTKVIGSIENIDADVLLNMLSLSCFKVREKLIEALLNEWHNTEKVIYFLLLERKVKKPSKEDEGSFKPVDKARKRVDTCKAVNLDNFKLATGSPAGSRRNTTLNTRVQSCNSSPCTSPLTGRENVFAKISNLLNISDLKQNKNTKNMNSEDKLIDALNNNCLSPSNVLTKLNSFKQNMFASPKISKRKLPLTPNPPRVYQERSNKPTNTPTNVKFSPNACQNTDTKSWFQRFNFKSSEKTNIINQVNDKDKEIYSRIMSEKPNTIKSYLVQAFFAIKELSHNIGSTINSFNCEMRVAKFQLGSNLNFRIDIVPFTTEDFKIKFTLLTGSSNMFKGIIQSILTLVYQQQQRQQQKSNDQRSFQHKVNNSINSLQANPISIIKIPFCQPSPQINRRLITKTPYNSIATSPMQRIELQPALINSSDSSISSSVVSDVPAAYYYQNNENTIIHNNNNNNNNYVPRNNNGANLTFT